MSVSGSPSYSIASLTGKTKWKFYIGLVMLGMYTAILLLFGISRMAGGDINDANPLFLAAEFVLIIWLAWRHPFETGRLLIMLGVLESIYILAVGHSLWVISAQAAFFCGLPLVIPGILLLLAGKDKYKDLHS